MVVHRDLKPANVLLVARATVAPPWPILKIADFGFAREKDQAGTVSGRYGSLLYMVRFQTCPLALLIGTRLMLRHHGARSTGPGGRKAKHV